jgi:transposase InsO family protein
MPEFCLLVFLGKPLQQLVAIVADVLYRVLSQCPDEFPPRYPLASCWFSFVLAMEVAISRRQTEGGARRPAVDPRHEPRQPAVGRSPDPWRTPQTRHRRWSNLGRQIHGKTQETPISRLEDVPSQPRRWDRLNGSLRRSDTLVSPALRLAHSMPRPAPNLTAGSDGTPERRMDGPATHRSLRLGTPTEVHHPRSRLCLWRIFTRRLRAMGIRDRPTAPQSPWQNGHTERLIGSIRRECLDHVVVFGERHLRHALLSYMHYYNSARTHLSLNKDAPVPRAVQAVGPILGGLHRHYVRI